MKIDLTPIYAGLKVWRHERGITAESQKAGYIVNIMEELGELSQALRGLEFENTRKVAEHEIIDALCDIAVLTINTGADIPESAKWAEIRVETSEGLDALMLDILMREISDNCRRFNKITICGVLEVCASLCHYYGYDFKIAMLETIKEISSRTGSYDEKAKKWVKDTSEQARAKWYSANYEKARIEK